jgi:SAM-dependent methyltransferase
MTEPDWRRLNRANWDERVAIHLGPGSDYDVDALRRGRYALHAIEEEELGPVDGLRLLHLQCHFGLDTLALAQRGAIVTGVDFSAPAIAAARALAAEVGLPATFVEADVYDARAAVDGTFDRVFTTWGTTCWLPDIAGWARVIASLLASGGELYFADVHPAALTLDDAVAGSAGVPGWFAPYFTPGALEVNEAHDYADPTARLVASRTHQFIHPLGATVQALLDAGLRLTLLREHDRLAWKAFRCLVETDGRLFRWPDKPWLPLAWSLKAVKPG